MTTIALFNGPGINVNVIHEEYVVLEPNKPESPTNSLFAPWVNLNPGKYTILERHKPEYTQLIMEANKDFPEVLAAIVADYVADGKVMDRQGWLEYFGVDIGEETENVKEAFKFENFYKIYHGPNPVDVIENGLTEKKIRQVCESCLIPTIRPQTVKSNGLIEDFYLIKLGEIAKYPIQGYAAEYHDSQSEALQQHGNTKAGPSSLVIMLKGAAAIGKQWSQVASRYLQEEGQIEYLQNLNNITGFGCKIPDALSQITILFAHHAVTGVRKLMGGVRCCTKEVVGDGQDSRQMTYGDFEQYASSPVHLTVEKEWIVKADGVGVMREF